MKHALRALARSPGYAFAVIATLALCLAANLTIFAVVDAVILRPLPFPQSDRLVTVFNSYPGAGYPRGGSSITNYFERRSAIPAFASVSLISDADALIGTGASARRVPIAKITPEFFETLGVPLAAGRGFTEEELGYGSDKVAIITDEFWHAHFHGNPDVLGTTFLVDDVPVTVTGVLPPGFRYLSSTARFFRPLSHSPADRGPQRRHASSGQMVARLAPGATVAQAQAQLDAINVREMADAADPMHSSLKRFGYHSWVRPLHSDHVASARPTLLLLQAGALFLLVIGLGNLANLLLVRASGRAKEMAVRQALGAGFRHVARAVLAETLLLSVAGGLLGIAIAAAAVRLIGYFGAAQLPLAATVAFDGRIAAVGAVAALATGVVLAVPVLWFSLHPPLSGGLHLGTRGGTSTRSAQRVRQLFIVVQISLAFVLLSGASLLGLSLEHLLKEPTGFNPEHVLTGEITLPWKHYPDQATGTAAAERILAAIRALPGVSDAALNNSLPFTGRVAGMPVATDSGTGGAASALRAHHRAGVTPDYWATMKIPLVRGRLLTAADDDRTPGVCVVDQAIADRYWPDADPVGHRLSFATSFSPQNAVTIVGVVANVKQNDLGEAGDFGMIYQPFAQFSTAFFYFAVRTAAAPDAIAPEIRNAVARIDPGLPVEDLKPLRTRIDDSLVARRSPALLAGVYAVIALLLASIGLYGVMAYGVAQRTREFGIRVALGAPHGSVLRLVLRQGAWLAAIGLAAGVLIAAAVNRYLTSLVFGIDVHDPATLVAAGVAIALVAALACIRPAYRATRVDPMIALRTDD